MMKSKNSYSLYIIRNNINDKVYIGITSGTVKRRLSRHIYQAKSGSQCIIHRAMRKYGFFCFSVDTLYEGLTSDQASDLEIKEISEREACGRGGYNIMEGGGTGVSLRPDLTRARKSSAGKKAWAKSDKMKKAIYSPSRLKKISEASKRSWTDPLYREKVLPFIFKGLEAARSEESKSKRKETNIKNGNYTKVECSNGMKFHSVNAAASWLRESCGKPKAAAANIWKCIKGVRQSAYGHTWVSIGQSIHNDSR
jgi:group I intron endonuclease